MADIEVRHVPERQRYEAVLDGDVAGFTEYEPRDDGVLVFPHTVVEKAYEGRGVGSALVRGALDDVRSQGRKIVPLCSFVAAWVDRHGDYEDVVAERP